MKDPHPARTSAWPPATKALVMVLLTASTLALLPTPGWAAEVFPPIVIKGEVCTNVSVVRTNPAEVILRWEGGGGGCPRGIKEPVDWQSSPRCGKCFERFASC
jgi:hypothetical protein